DLTPPRDRRLLRLLFQEIRLDLALDLDGHRIAATVTGLAGLHADPAFADRVFLDVVALDIVEAHADAALQGLRIVEGAGRVDRQVVGRGIAHRFIHSDGHHGRLQRYRINRRMPPCSRGRSAMPDNSDYFDFEEDAHDFDEDDFEARVWNLLVLINPGDEELALQQFNRWREHLYEDGQPL